ncbi:MAG: hypothetical protein ACXV8I_10770 [Methylobacter sp.]
MVEFAITVVLIALLISAILYFSRRKKSSSGYTSNEPVKYAPKEPLKKEAKYPPQQEKQPLTTPQVTDAKAVSSPAPEPASKIETPAKPQVEEPISAVKASNTVNSQVTDTKVVSSQKPEPVSTSTSKVEAPAKPQVQEAASTVKASGFPEESVLKRHYFYHLCTMIEELAPQCPTESVLRRHHYTMLATRIGQCLHDKKALEQLTYDYEHRSA